MILNPLTQIDYYKAGHYKQYPLGTEVVYSNLTARSAKLKNVPDDMYHGGTIFFGLQFFIKDFLQDNWNQQFFWQPKQEAVKRYQRRMDTSLGKGAVSTEHIEALHDLGYLPICIKALPEGTLVPIGVPMLVIYNTDKRFAWLTNYLETALSAYLWKTITTATTAFSYRVMLQRFAQLTGGSVDFVKWQGHDFSARGMSTPYDAAISGMGHLLSFTGTDTVAAIDTLEGYYLADAEKELIGGSVMATEHSTQCASTSNSKDIATGEFDTYRRLITEVCPSGIISIVSDTYDYWRVLTDYLPRLKNEILNRDGKLVIRPDSGSPLRLICGDPEAPEGSPARKGSLELLWEAFGGTVNEKGYRVLNPKVGLIYGDSITPALCRDIISTMEVKGYASTNVVFGIGSFTYNYTTRDTYGMAVKSTYCEVNGQPRNIFKDPVTDAGKMKKSLCGLVRVVRNAEGVITVKDQQKDIEDSGMLETVYTHGQLVKPVSLREIRQRLDETVVSLCK